MFIKRIFLTVCIITLLFGCFGCTSFTNRLNQLNDDIAPLYSEAVHSLLWIRGFSNSIERTAAPSITILEVDNYGRTLYEYNEGKGSIVFDVKKLRYEMNIIKEYYVSAILISQITDEGFVYYYPDMNYICRNIDPETHKPYDVTTEELEELKCKNDWNKSISLSACVRTRYDIYRSVLLLESDILYDDYNIESLENHFETLYDCSMRSFYLQKDRNGLVLGSMESFVYSGSDDVNPNILIIFIVDAEGEYKYSDNIELNFDKSAYRDAVIKLKSIAGWENDFVSEQGETSLQV